MGNTVAFLLKGVRSLRFVIVGIMLMLYCCFALLTSSCSSTAGNYNWAWWVVGAGAAYWIATEALDDSSDGQLTVENDTTLTLTIFVDNVVVGTVAPGGTASWSVDIGTHTLKAESGTYSATESYTWISGADFTWTLVP